MSAPPTHITLPPPPSWPDSFRLSPNEHNTPFFTPPTSPAPLQSPTTYFTPPSSPLDDHPVPLQTDDIFPPPVDSAIDFVLDDDGLSTLEKIYLYSRSRAAFHRVFIAHTLPEYLLQVTPQEAVEYVLPLLSGLAMDDDELVKEALAAELVSIIWWFFTHCQIIPDDLKPEEAYASSSTTVTISVQAFTPILGTLLLSSNPLVGGAGRLAIVELLTRMKKADDRHHGLLHRHHQPQTPGDIIHPWEIANADDNDDEDTLFPIGLFGGPERALFTAEILQQVVIGMGRLDVDDSPSQEQSQSHHQAPGSGSNQTQETSNNPYFPSLSANSMPTHYMGFHGSMSGHEAPSVRSSTSHTQGASSPGVEFSSDAATSSSSSPGNERIVDNHQTEPGSPMNVDTNWDESNYGEETDDEQAAVGRLSSMSLMAAVTASGVLDENTKRAFVIEVERIGRDNIYWVRREASFALGALAKVVPEELVLNSLLPLFDTLRWDAVWHVRHSALFALPAILTRLTPARRRTVALETLVALSVDQNATVRSGALEALGEVIFTFVNDPDGPPKQLLDLFLGKEENWCMTDGQQPIPARSQGAQTPLESFFSDPKRPLVCAFNFPAVVLTLGGRRWVEIRDAYLELASDSSIGVRKTLAASLGEIAKIIGPEHAQKDLISVWRTSIKTNDEDVRMKAIESFKDMVGVVGLEVGKWLVDELLTEWNEGNFRSWRERELIERQMADWINLISFDTFPSVLGLLKKGLEDTVASVREAAVSILPKLWHRFSSVSNAMIGLHHELEQLATSSNYRRRMTFISCQQALALSVDTDGQLLVFRDDLLFHSVAKLANDGIEGVRIGVARFVASTYGVLLRDGRPIPRILGDLVDMLSQDSSHEVKSYVAGLSTGGSSTSFDELSPSATSTRRSRNQLSQLATFSRPPQFSLPQPFGARSRLGNEMLPSGSHSSGTVHHSGDSSDGIPLQRHPPLGSGEQTYPSESLGPGLVSGIVRTAHPPSSEARERLDFESGGTATGPGASVATESVRG